LACCLRGLWVNPTFPPFPGGAVLNPHTFKKYPLIFYFFWVVFRLAFLFSGRVGVGTRGSFGAVSLLVRPPSRSVGGWIFWMSLPHISLVPFFFFFFLSLQNSSSDFSSCSLEATSEILAVLELLPRDSSDIGFFLRVPKHAAFPSSPYLPFPRF